MFCAVPILFSVLLLLTMGAAADRIIYPPLQNNEAMVMDPILVAEPYGFAPKGPYSMSVAYDVPTEHHHHDEAYNGMVYRPIAQEGVLPPNEHKRIMSTRVDEYGRPIPMPTPDTVGVSSSEMERRMSVDSGSPVLAADNSGSPVYDDEPFLHRALDHSQASTDVGTALDHDLGELNVREAGDDLTVHVGKNKVKTETVATITATITATDEHEDSYINVHRNAHEASAGQEHDHLNERTIYLDGAKNDVLDQNSGTEMVPVETPPPDLSFLQDVEVLKVLFPWLEKHTGGVHEPEQQVPKTLDHVVLA